MLHTPYRWERLPAQEGLSGAGGLLSGVREARVLEGTLHDKLQEHVLRVDSEMVGVQSQPTSPQSGSGKSWTAAFPLSLLRSCPPPVGQEGFQGRESRSLTNVWHHDTWQQPSCFLHP